MKKELIRLFSLMISVVMVFQLCACGAAQEQSAPEAALPDTQNSISEPIVEEAAEDTDISVEEPRPTMVISNLPDEFTERKLTDDELSALSYEDSDTLRSSISTFGDAVAWIAMQKDFTYIDGLMWSTGDNTFLSYTAALSAFDEEYLQYTNGQPMFGMYDSINIFTAWLLQDDYDGSGVLLALPYCKSFEGSYTSCMQLCCIAVPYDGEWYFFTAGDKLAGLVDNYSQGTYYSKTWMDLTTTLDSRPALITSSPEEAAELLSDLTIEIDNNTSFSRYSEIAFITDLDTDTLYTQRIDEDSVFTPKEGLTVLTKKENSISDEAYYYSTLNAGMPDWSEAIPYELGSASILEEEATELNKLSIDEAAAAINNVPDLLTYLYAGGFYFAGGDIWENEGNLTWHFNNVAETVNMVKCGNCGGTASLVRYLLDGDYDEVGYVSHTYRNGEGGGHVYNYIYTNDFYYIIDFTSLTGSDFNLNYLKLSKVNTLEEYANEAEAMFNCSLPVIYAYSSLREIPLAWGNSADGCSITRLPEGSEYTVIKESPDEGYTIQQISLSQSMGDKIEYAREAYVPNFEFLRANDPIKISSYKLPGDLGKTTLTYEEACELAWNTDIDTAAEKINTVGDLLTFFYASGYCYGDSDITLKNVSDRNYTWHFNHNAEASFGRRVIGCGQTASLVRYLLDGDYDEVGWLSCTWADGEGGGHVFNYILSDGVYYVIDMTAYSGSSYLTSAKGVASLGSSLDNCASKLKSFYQGNTMKVAYYYSSLREIPLAWGSTSCKVTCHPEQYADDIHLIFDSADEGYVLDSITLTEAGMNQIEKMRS